MIKNDFRNKAVLVTGGTKGLGLAIALAFAKEGAQTYLTYKWGTADEDALIKSFTDVGAPAPRLLEADASVKEDTIALLEAIKEHHDSIEVFVSNVSFAQVGGDVEQYKRRHFLKSLQYSAWPFMGYTQLTKKIFGSYPRYILATSCDGPETYYPGYEFVASSKVVMETFCKYMGKHLYPEGSRINILRSRPVSTDSLRATFGEDFEPFLRKYYGDDYFISAEEVGEAALCLCSGLLDAMTGQVVLLDRGVAFEDNMMRLFQHREEYGLE
jgi:enoyl-[acyl-carrier-protein] reductase (NADH)